jgi:hypothetical protein
MSIPDEAIIGTAIIIAAMQSDPEVVALKQQITDLEGKVAALPKDLLPRWQ